MKANKNAVEKVISEQMKRIALARSKSSRQAGGRKAWQTRIANLSAKLAASHRALNDSKP